jgi:uncharacterized protein
MARTYTTPGVYVEEISTLPRSVAEVSTAIPAFLGYTGKGEKYTPTRIETMMEYEQTFGRAPDAVERVTLKKVAGTHPDPAASYDIDTVTTKAGIPLLYYSLRLYFDNGGGPCYVVSLGDYQATKALDDFKNGLDALTKQDEPTLIVMPDATLLQLADFKTACQLALKHCGDMKNRFAILDVLQTDAKPERDAAAFRDFASEQLSYGAAYTPYLRSALAYDYDEKKLAVENLPSIFEDRLGDLVVTYQVPETVAPTVEIANGKDTGNIEIAVQGASVPKLTITLNGKRTAGEVVTVWESLSADQRSGFQLTAADTHAKMAATAAKSLKSTSSQKLDALGTSTVENLPAVFEGTAGGIMVTYKAPEAVPPKCEIATGQATGNLEIAVQDSPGPKLTITLNGQPRTAGQVITVWEALDLSVKKGFYLRAANQDAAVSVAAEKVLESRTSQTLEALGAANTGLYNRLKAVLANLRVILPPSGAVAGIYARVDRDRGVWKAPANVAVISVIDLTRTFTDTQQGSLNVDPTSGKSINVIRSMTGRGTLVWGARTLAGNDNEWRYIPVRRLFITIEESAKKASAFSVFEPNDATTWLKVKAMIESYLYGLWEQGALAGSRPEAAYFVNVGLGKTMTPQDVLEGRMLVEIGVAAVRPSEFIVLRFTHQLPAA